MNWCALPHDMTYTGTQGQPSQQQQQPPGQPPPPPSQPQLPPSAAPPPAKKPKPPKEPGAKRQRSKAAAAGGGGKKGKAEAGDDGASEVLGARPATPDPDLADPELAGARETANPALDSEVVVIHAAGRHSRFVPSFCGILILENSYRFVSSTVEGETLGPHQPHAQVPHAPSA